MFKTLKSFIGQLSAELPSAKFYLVGGSVRDALMDNGNFHNPNIKDLDVEVFNVLPSVFERTLAKLGVAFDCVGQSFGVYKVHVDGETFDFAFPRREKKNGIGYKGFEVEIDPFMAVEEACGRRDLTINAMAYDIQTSTLIDPFNGQGHLFINVLHPTTEAFKEDPLRVLRAFQFISRFDSGSSIDLILASHELLSEKPNLTPERIWVEWEKWCTRAIAPSKGLEFLFQTGWIESELFDLIGIEQDPTHHPEGDAFNHTLCVVDAMSDICNREQVTNEEKTILMLTALCHDLGKAVSTKWNEKKQKWTAYNHQITGVPLAESFLTKINCPLKFRRPILTIVREHMVHLLEEPNDKNVRRLVNRLVDGKASMRLLAMMVEADVSGRPPLPKGQSPRFIKWLDRCAELNLTGESKIPQLIGGDVLIGQFGLKEGKEMGDLLKEIYQAQLDGKFQIFEEGLVFIQKKYPKKLGIYSKKP